MEIDMFFITNKIIKKAGQQFIFDKTNEISQSLQYCRMEDDKKFSVIGSKSFMKTLMTSKEIKEIMFYIHGFNNQPYENILPRAKAIQAQLKDAKLNRILVVPIIWPCDNDFGIIKDYWDDQDSAEHTGKILSRSISKLVAWQAENSSDPCMKRMHTFAHSMGARVLTQCLKNWADKFGSGGVPYLFKNIFLMAADIPNESLEKGEDGEFIPQAAQRVLSYYANDDFAMPASKISNMKNRVFSRRIGHTGPEDMAKVPTNVYAINCDSFNNTFDTNGHSYFTSIGDKTSPAFNHVIKVLKSRKQNLDHRNISI